MSQDPPERVYRVTISRRVVKDIEKLPAQDFERKMQRQNEWRIRITGVTGWFYQRIDFGTTNSGMPWYNPRAETIWVILNAESQVPSRRHVSARTSILRNMERTQTSIDRYLLDAVRELAAEEGRDKAEVIEEAVSRYLAAFAGHVPEHVLERLVSSDREVSEERRAAARIRLFEVAGSGGLDDKEAQALAEEAVRRARAETERRAEAAAPSPEEVRARREARIRGSS